MEYVTGAQISLPQSSREQVPDSDGGYQVWHAIQAVHPVQAFSREFVYHFWHNQIRSAWVRDADEMRSAKAILLEAGVPNRVGPYALEQIDVEMPEGLCGFAFAVPVMLEKWGSWIREIALDSACKGRAPMVHQ